MPESKMVAQLSGPCTLMAAQCQNDTAQTQLGKVALSKSYDGSGLVVVRPEHLSIQNGEPNAKVIDLAYRGAQTECYVETEFGKIQLFVDSKNSPTPKSACHVSIDGPCWVIPD